VVVARGQGKPSCMGAAARGPGCRGRRPETRNGPGAAAVGWGRLFRRHDDELNNKGPDKVGQSPICTAPFTGVVIDTHKGIRPCCSWDDLYFGNLGNETLSAILAGARWAELKEDHLRGVWPKGCLNCREREEQTGWSLRQSYIPRDVSLGGSTGCYFSPHWDKGLTYLELNSTNLCNLACIHCTGAFSTRWLPEEQRMERDGRHFEGHGRGGRDGMRYQTHEVHLPDNRLLLDNLAGIDLDRLAFVNLKGGEPMLNSDVKVLLGFLRSKGILPQVEVHVSTNGTLTDAEILEGLACARRVRIWLSVDGSGPVQEYIRFGDSSIGVIERTIAECTRLGNVEFGLCTSVMPYNIFSLERIYEWWRSLPKKFRGRARFLEPSFSLMITVPAYLSVRCLQDATRRRLAAYYERLDRGSRQEGGMEPLGLAGLARRAYGLVRAGRRRSRRRGPYADVVTMLEQPYLGDDLHNRFVEYTLAMDEYRGTRILEVAPELEDEMVIL